MPSSSSRRATASTTVCVSEIVSSTRTSGFARWNSQRSRGHDGGAGPRRCADRQLAAELAVGLAGHFLDELLLEGQEPLRAAIEANAGFGGLDAPPRPVEELLSESLLERADLQTDRRLRDAETLSRLREALELDDRAERCELARVHKGILCKSC